VLDNLLELERFYMPTFTFIVSSEMIYKKELAKAMMPAVSKNDYSKLQRYYKSLFDRDNPEPDTFTATNHEIKQVLLYTMLNERRRKRLSLERTIESIDVKRYSFESESKILNYLQVVSSEIALLNVFKGMYIGAMSHNPHALIIHMPSDCEFTDAKTNRNNAKAVLNKILYQKRIADELRSQNSTEVSIAQAYKIDSFNETKKIFKSQYTQSLIDSNGLYKEDTEKILQDKYLKMYTQLKGEVIAGIRNMVDIKGWLDYEKLTNYTAVANKIGKIIATKECMDEYSKAHFETRLDDSLHNTNFPDKEVTRIYRDYKKMLGNDELTNYVFLAFNYAMRMDERKIILGMLATQQDEDTWYRKGDNDNHVTALSVLMDKNRPNYSQGVQLPKPNAEFIEKVKKNVYLSAILYGSAP
jgi:hypothetical protein